MCQRVDSILAAILFAFFLSLPVQEAGAMSLFHHHHNDGASQPSISGNLKKPSSNSTIEQPSRSNLQSIDAQPYITPVPEPSTVVLLGSGVVTLGLWRWKKHDQAVHQRLGD